MQSENSDVPQESILRQATIRRSITDIKYIGKMAHRSPRHMIKGSWHEVKAVTDFATVKTMEKEEAKAAGLYEVIGAAIDDAYIAELKKLVVHQDAIDQSKRYT